MDPAFNRFVLVAFDSMNQLFITETNFSRLNTQNGGYIMPRYRNDGLLRGSRSDRSDEVSSIVKSEWNLESLLDFHIGLLDHADEVNDAAYAGLAELAKSNPSPVTVSPMDLFNMYFGGTIARRVELAEVILNIGTPEANELLKDKLTSIGSFKATEEIAKMLQAEGAKSIIEKAIRDPNTSKDVRKVLRKVIKSG